MTKKLYLLFQKGEETMQGLTIPRNIGESTVIPVPELVRQKLQLKVGQQMEVEVRGNSLIVRPEPTERKNYTMEELLAASDYGPPQPPEEREWVYAPAVGGELL